MGYTHYWSYDLKTTKDKKAFKEAIKTIQSLVYTYNKSLTKGSSERLSGVTAHAKGYDGVSFNGSGDMSHEDFVIQHDKLTDRNFCKTAQKPYDIAVVASLCILKHYLGDACRVASDGSSADWIAGLCLARTKLKSIKMPKELKTELRIVS